MMSLNLTCVQLVRDIRIVLFPAEWLVSEPAYAGGWNGVS